VDLNLLVYETMHDRTISIGVEFRTPNFAFIVYKTFVHTRDQVRRE
jgi:hypothetical protein